MLEAVNCCLAAISEAPVASIDTSQSTSVQLAKQFLSECSKTVQSQPWHFNTDTDYVLAREPDGRIPVPDNVFRMDTTKKFADYDVTYRAGYVYNKGGKTFVFDKDLEFDITWVFPFEDLPEAARWFITVQAARRLQARLLPSNSGVYAEEDETRAWIAFKEAEGDNGDYNILRDSYSVSNILQRYPGGYLWP